MALNNVSQFLQTIGQGVKPNMFQVSIEFPSPLAKGSADLDLTNILCKSAALPCLLYTSPSPRDRQKSRMPSSA